MRRLLFAAVLVAVAGLAYFRVFGVFFGVDDFTFLERARDVHWPGLSQALADRFFAHGLCYFVARRVFGFDSVGYHLLPFGLHLLNAGLVYAVLSRLRPADRRVAAIAAVLFALHPAAYTVLAWITLGNEEAGVLAFSLGALLFAQLYLREGRTRYLLPVIVLTGVGLGFKNQAVMMPAYVLAVWLADGPSAETDRRAGAMRLVFLLVPLVLASVWYVHAIVPLTVQAASAAYTRNYSPASLLSGYFRLLPNSLNPLPILREGLGYQETLPPVITALPGFPSSVRAFVLVAMGMAAFASGVALTRVRFLLAFLFLLMAGLLFAAAMPGHMFEYYAYYSLPAACAVAALPAAWLVRAIGTRRPRGRLVVVVFVLAVLTYAFVTGRMLHSSNRFVRQADNARAVDALVTRHAVTGDTIVFVPPSNTAYDDTVYGLSIRALHPERHLSVVYADAHQDPATITLGWSRLLIAVDDIRSLQPGVHRVEDVQWVRRSMLTLSHPGQSVTQTLRLHGLGTYEVQVVAEAFGSGCAANAEIWQLHPRRLAARGVLPCPAEGGPAYVPVSAVIVRTRESGDSYELTITGGSQPITLFGGPSTSHPAAMLVERSQERVMDWALAFRTVVLSDPR
jgi:hypothetical protein